MSICLAQSGPASRFAAAGRGLSASSSLLPLVWVGAAVVGALVMIGLMVAVLAVRDRLARRDRWVRFNEAASSAGLDSRQLELLHHIANCSGLDENVHNLLANEPAFQDALLAYRHTEDFLGATDDQRLRLNATITDICRKLGMINHADATPRGTRQLPEAARVKLLAPEEVAQGAVAFVASSTEEHLRLRFKGSPPSVDARPGWRLHFFDGRTLWEYDATILAWSGQELVVGHNEQGRVLKRRRFPRVPVDFRAMLCPFTFETAGPSLAVPEWDQARLVQLAGPGLKLESRTKYTVGQRLLAIVQIAPQQTVRGMGIVRRIDRPDAGRPELVLELTGLTREHLGELACATSLADERLASRKKHLRLADAMQQMRPAGETTTEPLLEKVG